MKSSKFLILMLLFGFIVPFNNIKATVEVSSTESSLKLQLAEVNPETEIWVAVEARFNDTTLIEGAGVIIDVTDGIFIGNSSGFTDANGIFNTTWESPFVSFNDQEIVVEFNASIDVDFNTTIYVFNTITVKPLNNFGIGKSILYTPPTVVSGETIELSTRVLNNNSQSVSGIDVTYFISDGIILSNFQDISDLDGFVNITWQAPILDEFTSELDVTVDSLIQASNAVNITLTAIITVQANVSQLAINVDSLDQINSEETTLISVNVLIDSNPAVGADVEISVDEGTFNNSLSIILLSVNSSGFANVNWTAPLVTDILDLIFVVQVNYLTISSTINFTITVNPILHDFIATWEVTTQEIYQNATTIVKLTISDKDSSNPVNDTTVSLSLDTGFWDESLDTIYVTNTDTNGVVTATINTSNEIIILEKLAVNITAFITKTNYNNLESSATITVLPIAPSYNYTYAIIPSNMNITLGEKLEITLVAMINGLKRADQTFKLSANGGIFPNGDDIYHDKTNVSGILSVIWSSSSITSIQEALDIYITIEYINSGLKATTIKITVNPISQSSDGASKKSTETLGDTDNFITENPALMGLIAALIAGAVGLGIFIKRK